MRKCEYCIWVDQCGDVEPCEHFSPTDESYEALIEMRRTAFLAEWDEYIEEFAG